MCGGPRSIEIGVGPAPVMCIFCVAHFLVETDEVSSLRTHAGVQLFFSIACKSAIHGMNCMNGDNQLYLLV